MTHWAETLIPSIRLLPTPGGSLLRVLALSGLATLAFALGTVGTDSMPLRPDLSRAALANLGQEYGDLQQWTGAILAATDSLEPPSAERARVLAGQLARLMRPLERDFEQTTAAMSTSQLDLVLPLWERMAFAHAGFVMLQERAEALGSDPNMDPAELHDLAIEVAAVLDFAAEIQQLVLDELTAPPVPTQIRIT